MANKDQLEMIGQGVDVWNNWRKENPGIQPDLSRANLKGADLARFDLRKTFLYKCRLQGADLTGVILRGADLRKAKLCDANLSPGADLRWARFYKTDLSNANLNGALLQGADLRKVVMRDTKLRKAFLRDVNLREADLYKADLTSADLTNAVIVGTNLEQAILQGCNVYGIAVWNPNLVKTKQMNLVVTPYGEPEVTVDDLEVAQFVYLVLNNEKIRNVIDTIGKKGVLILGRFTKNRKAVLNAIREELRKLDYVPMMFDFQKPTDKDFTETVMTLAGMSRFIIADISKPKCSPLELQSAVPNYMVPFVPIIREGEKPFAMFKDLYGKFDWVLEPLEYDTAENLIQKLEKGIINRALQKHKELIFRKAKELQIIKLDDL